MPLSCIVFDCDGVILDSVFVKARAFARVAEPFGAEARDMLVMYQATHGGVSRYEAFAWMYRAVLGREITPEDSRRLGQQFAEYALDEVKSCPLIPGIAQVLDDWHDRLPLCVCSGTPTEELRKILGLRRLSGYFRMILGSPPAKAKVLETIVDSMGLDPADVLMVGDSVVDRDAAEVVGTQFYGRGPELKCDRAFPWAEDLTGLSKWIDEHVE